MWLLTDDCNPLLIPLGCTIQHCRAVAQCAGLQMPSAQLNSASCYRSPPRPHPHPPSHLHFLLVYLLCRRSQASNWLVGLIWQHPPPSPFISLPSVSPSKDFWLIRRPPLWVAEEKKKKSESNGRTEGGRERESDEGKGENKTEMGGLYYPGVKVTWSIW